MSNKEIKMKFEEEYYVTEEQTQTQVDGVVLFGTFAFVVILLGLYIIG